MGQNGRLSPEVLAAIAGGQGVDLSQLARRGSVPTVFLPAIDPAIGRLIAVNELLSRLHNHAADVRKILEKNVVDAKDLETLRAYEARLSRALDALHPIQAKALAEASASLPALSRKGFFDDFKRKWPMIDLGDFEAVLEGVRALVDVPAEPAKEGK